MSVEVLSTPPADTIKRDGYEDKGQEKTPEMIHERGNKKYHNHTCLLQSGHDWYTFSKKEEANNTNEKGKKHHNNTRITKQDH